MMDRWQWLMLFLILAIGVISNWMLAVAGHPTAVWLWHDVLGLL